MNNKIQFHKPLLIMSFICLSLVYAFTFFITFTKSPLYFGCFIIYTYIFIACIVGLFLSRKYNKKELENSQYKLLKHFGRFIIIGISLNSIILSTMLVGGIEENPPIAYVVVYGLATILFGLLSYLYNKKGSTCDKGYKSVCLSSLFISAYTFFTSLFNYLEIDMLGKVMMPISFLILVLVILAITSFGISDLIIGNAKEDLSIKDQIMRFIKVIFEKNVIKIIAIIFTFIYGTVFMILGIMMPIYLANGILLVVLAILQMFNLIWASKIDKKNPSNIMKQKCIVTIINGVIIMLITIPLVFTLNNKFDVSKEENKLQFSIMVIIQALFIAFRFVSAILSSIKSRHSDDPMDTVRTQTYLVVILLSVYTFVLSILLLATSELFIKISVISAICLISIFTIYSSVKLIVYGAKGIKKQNLSLN